MNKCRADKKLISRYIDGDLEPARQFMLNRHLITCAECRGIADGYSRVRSLLREHYAETVHKGQAQNFSADAQGENLKRVFFPSVYSLAATLIIAVCIVTFFFMRPHRTHSDLLPVVIGTESTPLMNSPLGSIMYYEELSGKTVNAQFHCLNDTNRISAISTGSYALMTYESPLFHDNSLLQQQYASVIDR